MAPPIVLTAQQTEAVTFVLDQIQDGAPICAILGLAGTGKTSLVPTLRDQLQAMGHTSHVGSPTHRAAMVLRKKGIPDAGTIHSLALTPYFSGDYAAAMQCLGEVCACTPEAYEEREPEVNGVPALIVRGLERGGSVKTMRQLMNRASRYGARKALESIGVHGKEHFTGFGPRQGEGILIIDEASMVGAEMLNLCMTAYPHVVCIGDPGQLPPVKDDIALDQLTHFQLTEIHRQAADSPIIQLAYAARQGTQNWTRTLPGEGAIGELSRVDARAFLTSPLIVWRNSTRLTCTKAIRAALGYPADMPEVGEPLVCRATGQEDRANGFINNSLWRVVALTEPGSRRATVQEDGADGTVDVLLHMEEVDGEMVDPEAVSFRWGYCLTAHTAQGGEWDRVYIHKPDLLAYEARCKASGSDDLQKWAYTAITRAKGSLCFLLQENFALLGETMPLMNVPTDDAPQMALPETSAPDDIADPPVPPGAVPALEDTPEALGPLAAVPRAAMVPADGQTLAMANGFCQYVQAQMDSLLKETAIKMARETEGLLNSMADFCKGVLEETAIKMARETEGLLNSMADFCKGVLASNEHSAYQLSDALLKVQSGGLTIAGSPYAVTIRALTAEGFEVQLRIEKREAGEMVEELERLMPWLASNGYTGITQEAA